jgi:alanine-glyoxylate transaminase/serine-glyoxylate transaminase/serine-pyruvate transaminase
MVGAQTAGPGRSRQNVGVIPEAGADPLLMIPGPTPLSPAVRAAAGAAVRGHATAEPAASLGRIQAGVREVVGLTDGDVFILPGSGTLALETAVVNHVRPGERVVVVNHGYFADRLIEICEVHGIVADQVRADWGRHADRAEVRARLQAGPAPAMLAITHVDTSTGTRADVADLSAAGRAAGAMVMVDGVCSTAAVAERMDELGIDLLATASQKALAAPPGLAIVAGSPAARERREGVGRPRAYYMDLARWRLPMGSTAYFATHATTLVRALDVSVGEIIAEGLEARFRRHADVAESFRDGFTELGFSLLTDADALAPTLSVLQPPGGVDEAAFRAALLAEGVLVAGGIGPFAGRAIRVGHMGTTGASEAALTVAAAGRALERL